MTTLEVLKANANEHGIVKSTVAIQKLISEFHVTFEDAREMIYREIAKGEVRLTPSWQIEILKKD